jgi:hypothetical protein
MKKIVIIILFFCWYLPAHAQSLDTGYKPKLDSLPKPLFVVKWAPLGLIDFDPTMQFGLEYLPSGMWSVQQEVGYGRFGYSGFFTPDEEDTQQKEVWRFRTEARKYLSHRRPKPTGAYLAFEVLYKRVNYKGNEEIGRNCVNGRCEYKELVQNKIFKDALGFHIKFGVQSRIGKRAVLDCYMGIGGRSVNVKATNKELEEFWKDDHQIMVANPQRPGNYGLISGNLGFKLGYLLYKQ